MADTSIHPAVTAVIFGALVLLWTAFLVLKFRRLATVRSWEVTILSLLGCALALPFVAVLSLPFPLIFAAPVLLILLNHFYTLRQPRIGARNYHGLLQTVFRREKKVRTISSPADLEGLDEFILSPEEFEALQRDEPTELKDLVSRALQLDISLISIFDYIQRTYGYVHAEDRLSIDKLRMQRQKTFSFAKRLIDFLLASILLIATLPLLVFVALICLLLQGRPVFFRQTRLGKGGLKFEILKIRTMQHDIQGDEIVTPIGQFLRATHIDELPQLLNILKGDMAFVGPRPEWVLLTTPEEAPENYWMRQAVRPGLTGWAQVNYRPSNTRFRRRRKLGYDLFYINNRSVFLDVLIWFRTILKIMTLRVEN